MPTQSLNKDILYTMVATELFSASVGSDCIGLELEMFVVAQQPGISSTIPLVAKRGVPSLTLLLAEIAEQLGGTASLDNPEDLSVELPGGGRITLEPSGQVEYSGPPFRCNEAAIEDLRYHVLAIRRVAARHGCDIVIAGYNNAYERKAIDLVVEKPRYLAMDRHFETVGGWGRRMMRATCSLQLNLDFGRADILSERWRLANMMSPSLNAIFANSPLVHQQRYYHSFRYEVWRRTDRSRTGRLFDIPDLDPVEDYLRFALDASVMMLGRGGRMVAPTLPITFRQWMCEGGDHGFPDITDWQLHLTTLFPDVRPRGWMELRTIDAVPKQWWWGVVFTVTRLLYNDRVRQQAIAMLEARPRLQTPGEHEHNGYWSSDFATGLDLLALVVDTDTDSVGRSNTLALLQRKLAHRRLA